LIILFSKVKIYIFLVYHIAKPIIFKLNYIKMKKIILLLFLLISSLGYAQTSNYCSTEVLHLNIPAETASAVNLTIVNTGATKMKVTVANADISFLDLLGTITGNPTKSAADSSIPGEISITLTWAAEAPDNVTIQFIQWRKAGAATWQINDATTPFTGVCVIIPPGEDATLSDLQVDSATLTDFAPGKENYDFSLAEGTTVVPTITGATVNEAGATTVITQATGIPGDASVVVTASGGIITKTYTVSFFIAPPTEPTTAAPIPTSLPADVISVYSDTYTSIATNLNPGWGQATTMTEIDLAGNLAMKYANLNYQGIEYASSDVSAMEYIHLDYYTADATAFQFFLIAGGENPYDVAATDGITTGEWVSIDIPLSYFLDAGRDLTTAFQFKTTGNNTLYLDNIYFYKSPTATGKVATLSALEVDGTSVAGFTPNKSTYLVELVGGTTEVPQVTSATTSDAAASRVITQASSIPGAASVLVTSQDGSTTKTYTISYFIGAPNTNAPTPPVRETLDVISIFSDTYNNISDANYNPDWQQSGLSSANVAFQPTGSGNAVLAYPNFNYQGIEFSSAQDLTAMEFLHLDIWTVNGVAPAITVISSGTEIPHSITNGDGQWQSIEIPVAGITGDVTKAIQLKFTGGNGSSTAIYVDNIYFYKSPTVTGEDATLSALEIDGNTVAGFTPNSQNYLVALPGGTTVVPQITLATTTDASASRVITQATAIPGDATVLVTAQDGTTKKTYKLSFFIGAPNVNAPTPPARNAIDVISIFSGTYNNITGANYNPNWQQSGFSSANAEFQPTGSGNAVLAYTNFNYQGIEFNSVQDITSMEFLHLDIWTVKGVIPTVSVISSGAVIPHTISNGDGKWQSIEIPVANITTDLTRTIQLMFNGGNGSPNAIYVDNIYFYKTPSTAGKDATLSELSIDGVSVLGFTPNSESYLMPLLGGTTIVPQITLATTTDVSATTTITQAASIPGEASVVVTSQDGTITKTYKVSFYIGAPNVNAPTPIARETSDVISIFSDAYNNIIGANYNPDWQQSGLSSANIEFKPAGTGNSVLAYTNFSYQGIEFNSVQDLTSMEFLHLDIWTVNGVIPSITVISSGTEIPHTITNGDGTWQSIDIAVAGITEDITKAIHLKFNGGNGFSNAIYVDNIYFWKAASLGTNNVEILNFNAFPNPSQNSWTIKTNNVNITSIKVFDLQGKNVFSSTPNKNTTDIDGTYLKGGVYFAQIKTTSGVKIMKLIKK
jgi:hypothetical protein